MGIYNEILAARFARGIQKIFSMKGDMPTKQLSGEMMPVIITNDLLSLEHRVLLNIRSFARSGISVPAAATFRSSYRLRNPTSSNVVAVLEKFNAQGPLTDSPFVTRGPLGTGDLASSDVGQNSVRDARMGAVNSSLVASFANNSAATVGVVEAQVQFAANGMADAILLPSQEIVIAPGDVLTFYSNVINQALQIELMWRERALEESELFG